MGVVATVTAIPTIPTISTISNVANVSRVAAVSNVSDVPRIATVSNIAAVTTISHISAVPHIARILRVKALERDQGPFVDGLRDERHRDREGFRWTRDGDLAIAAVVSVLVHSDFAARSTHDFVDVRASLANYYPGLVCWTILSKPNQINQRKRLNTKLCALRTIVAVMMMPPLLLDPPLLACADTGEELTLTFFFSGGSSDGDCISSRSRSRFSVDTLVDTDMVGTPPL
jgi:hypothetical protein